MRQRIRDFLNQRRQASIIEQKPINPKLTHRKPIRPKPVEQKPTITVRFPSDTRSRRALVHYCEEVRGVDGDQGLAVCRMIVEIAGKFCTLVKCFTDDPGEYDRTKEDWWHIEHEADDDQPLVTLGGQLVDEIGARLTGRC